MINPFSNHRGICVSGQSQGVCADYAAVVAVCAVAVCHCICEMLLLFTYIVEQSAIENNHVSFSSTLLHFHFLPVAARGGMAGEQKNEAELG